MKLDFTLMKGHPKLRVVLTRGNTLKHYEIDADNVNQFQELRDQLNHEFASFMSELEMTMDPLNNGGLFDNVAEEDRDLP